MVTLVDTLGAIVHGRAWPVKDRIMTTNGDIRPNLLGFLSNHVARLSALSGSFRPTSTLTRTRGGCPTWWK